MYGWPASYKLAEIAKQEGLDLSQLSREDYAEYAIKNCLTINADLLRAYPTLRNCMSPAEVKQLKREIRELVLDPTDKAFHAFSVEMIKLAELAQRDRYISKEVRVLSGTKNSNSWLFFAINNGTNTKATEAHKTYLTFKDLNVVSPERLKAFMSTLQMFGYNGGLKIFQDIKDQSDLNDQIVMHGDTKKDAEDALNLAKQFFGDEIFEPSTGLDQVISGKDTSYSEILAARISLEVKNA